MAILLAKVNTNNVPDSPGRWLAGEIVAAFDDAHTFGSAEVPSAGNFYHITVTDKTLAEVESYLQSWNHDPVTTQVSAVGNDRVLQVVSTMVSASGKNAFTQVQVEDFCTQLNETYPTANSSYENHNNTGFQFNVTVPLAQRDELIEQINQFVESVLYKRRRWYINSAGMTFLAGNGGVVSGTAAQVNQYLRDGLLD